MSLVVRNLSSMLLACSDTNRSAQLQKMALLNNKNKANGKMHAYAKSSFLMTRVYVVFPFFGITNIFTRKAQKTQLAQINL